ncbi:hypothetical protein IMSAGC009_01481 [Lachnospiraceae bacterium]|jgi:hypothetical protein|nr:hypothetical protein IMSAGC009_01481 [Lachnospiraceae bacterium]
MNPVYPFVFMDCIHYKAREDGRILSQAAYVVLGVTTEGEKEILSITVGANESSKFWMGMLNDLKDAACRTCCSSAWTACQASRRRLEPCSYRPRFSDASSTCCATRSNM